MDCFKWLPLTPHYCRLAPPRLPLATAVCTNTSGYTGVYQHKKSGKWVAQITFRKKTYYLGAYSDIHEAVKARQRAEEMHDEFLEWYYSEYLAKKEENDGQAGHS